MQNNPPPNSDSRSRLTLPLVMFVALCGVVVLVHRSHAPGEQTITLGQLSLETSPPGASLIVNGRLAGSTPLTLSGLQPGPYRIRLEREGCQPVSFKVDMATDAVKRTVAMEPLPAGSLVVEVQPAGADVLLDGELVGQTPLTLKKLNAGAYDMVIRKTNFAPYAARVEIAAGETQKYAGMDLTDRVQNMLDGLIRAEPQRLTHYIDLAHYYFINNNIDKSVETYSKGFEVMQTPLNFEGAGFPGKAAMSPEEIAQEMRSHETDGTRLLKEIDKHKNFPGKDCSDFKRKVEQAIEMAAVKNPSWEWAERSASVNIGNGNYEKGEKIYTDFIAVAGAAADVPKAYVALLDLNVRRHEMQKARDHFDAFYKTFSSNAAALRLTGEALMNKPLERIASTADKTRMQEMIQQTFLRAIEITADKADKAKCQAELGLTYLQLNNAAAAVEQYQASVAATDDATIKDERLLSLAGALRRSNKLAEAKEICEKLRNSETPKVRVRAQVELETIQNVTGKK